MSVDVPTTCKDAKIMADITLILVETAVIRKIREEGLSNVNLVLFSVVIRGCPFPSDVLVHMMQTY